MNYEYYLRESYNVALDSEDPSTQNGAVLMDNDTRLIIGMGYNHFPRGVDKKYWHGPKQDKYLRVVHAEVAAILSAAKAGCRTTNSTLICAWSACSNCAKHIAASGVTRLVRHPYANSGTSTGSHWYEDCIIGDDIMQSAGIEIIEVPPLNTDIQLRRDGKLWPVEV